MTGPPQLSQLSGFDTSERDTKFMNRSMMVKQQAPRLTQMSTQHETNRNLAEDSLDQNLLTTREKEPVTGEGLVP